MNRSRRAKSQSVSSNNADGLINGSMSPPSPPPPPAARSSPALRRKRAPSTTNTAPSPPVAVVAVVPPRATDTRVPSVPSSLQFVLVILLSASLEALLQSAASFVNTGDLAAISKHSESWVEVAALLSWKAFTLGIYWFGGFDAIDVASLTILLQSPTFILYYFFYLVHPATIGLSILATTISTSLPFYALRPVSPYHDPHHRARPVRNRPIITDSITTTATSAIATIIFAAILQLSFSTFLPTWLITRFVGLRSLEFVYQVSTSLLTLLLWLAPAGFASTQFLFRAAEGVTEATASEYNFNPQTGSFGEHIYHNAWGWYTVRQKELIGRTIILGLLVVAETIVQVWGTLEGVDPLGAVGYAAIWGVAVAVIGTVLDWVGGPSD